MSDLHKPDHARNMRVVALDSVSLEIAWTSKIPRAVDRTGVTGRQFFLGQWFPKIGVLQSNVKRMLAYSSIGHAGYLLLGIVSANSAGKAAILFYLLAYAVTNLGALGIVALLGTAAHPHDQLRDFAQRFRIQGVIHPAALAAVGDEPGVLQHLQVERQPRLGGIECISQITDATLAEAEAL